MMETHTFAMVCKTIKSRNSINRKVQNKIHTGRQSAYSIIIATRSQGLMAHLSNLDPISASSGWDRDEEDSDWLRG